ncbi:amidohydrolase family protein [Flavobacterium psychrotrophum]|uniref:amidohydrolase family protein n=1 Tax=Flavobacterium psychrotrophum TaxID=2294119 RepID=UPI000E3226CE|nr:amidohydrolase family protein [Flavobacterium psychrotrophum]
MIIDAHVHFWHYDAVKNDWITDDMKVIQKDFLPADASAVLAQNGVDGCIAVQSTQSDAETDFLLELAAENTQVKGVVGWINLADPDILEVLEGYKTEKKLKGLRHVAQGEPRGFLLRDEIVTGIKQVGLNGYTYDILIYDHQLEDAIQLTEKLSGQPFILNHCGKPALRSGAIKNWKSGIKELATNPDVSCKISGLLTEDKWHNCNEKQLSECFDTIFENFGTSRILFGSDWPVVNVAGTYTQWMGFVKQYISQCTTAQQQDILGNNAARIYNL